MQFKLTSDYRPTGDQPEAIRQLTQGVESGLAAQTGAAARPTFAADLTVTMLAFKPGLAGPAAAPWTGAVKLAKLGVDVPALRNELRGNAAGDGAGADAQA